MDDIERRLPAAQRQLNRAFDGGFHVLVTQGHGSRRVEHEIDLAACMVLEHLRDTRHVSERGAHEKKLRVGKREQRNLPRPPAIYISEVMELIHRDATDVGVFTLAQRLVRENFRRAADNRASALMWSRP